MDNPIQIMDVGAWRGPFAQAQRDAAVDALEAGKVLFLPKLGFALTGAEQPLLSPALSDGKSKNISLEPDGRLKHATVSAEGRAALQAMMQRFASSAIDLITGLVPRYAARLE